MQFEALKGQLVFAQSEVLMGQAQAYHEMIDLLTLSTEDIE